MTMTTEVKSLAVRMGTSDADEAHVLPRAAGVTLHNEDVLRMDGAPPMFHFADPDGNGLVYLKETPSGGGT